MKVTSPAVTFLAVCLNCTSAVGDTNQATDVLMQGRWLSPSEAAEARRLNRAKWEEENSITNLNESAVRRILPQQYTAFQASLSRTYGIQDVRAGLVLLGEARAIAGTTSGSDPERREVLDGYVGAWRLCLRLYKGSTNSTARDTILEQWNAGLQASSMDAAAQLYALSRIWDRELLTEEFWRLFEVSESRPMVATFAFALYRHGDESDAERIARKRDSLRDPELQGLLQNALNYMNARFRGREDEPWIPSLPPSPEWPPANSR